MTLVHLRGTKGICIQLLCLLFLVNIITFPLRDHKNEQGFTNILTQDEEEVLSVYPVTYTASPIEREKNTLSQDGDLNVSGVRIYNFYPLELTSNLFSKNQPYSEAKLGNVFAKVLGFNDTTRNEFLSFLSRSSLIIGESIEVDHQYN